MRVLPLLVFALAMACGGGAVPAPEVETVIETCLPGACLDHPQGWEVERGEGFLNFRHPANPRLLASLSQVNMEAIVEASGGSWPTSPENVVRDFWGLLGESQEAEIERLTTTPSGRIVSRGRVGDEVLWHLLVPLRGGAAWALTVRAPDPGWEVHARVFLEGLRVDRG